MKLLEPRRDLALVWRSVLTLRLTSGVMGGASVIWEIVKEELGCFYEGEEGGRWREVGCVVWR